MPTSISMGPKTMGATSGLEEKQHIFSKHLDLKIAKDT